MSGAIPGLLPSVQHPCFELVPRATSTTTFCRTMKIAAKDYYRKGELLPFVSWKSDLVTTFGDHQVESDLPGRRVVRTTGVDSVVIAQIRDGYKGARLPEFFGTVESDAFTVTKRFRLLRSLSPAPPSPRF